MTLSKLSHSDVEMLIELHYSNARLARFLFLLLNAKCYQWNRRCSRSCW